MQIHEDKEVQHASSNGLQRPARDTCFRVTGFADYSPTAKAGTLKADGGDAGGQRELYTPVPEEGRCFASHRLQRGEKPDGLRGEVDFMQKAYTLKIRGGETSI